jgi:hypothetical protein
MKTFLGSLLITVLLAAATIVAILAVLNTTAGRASTEAAHATAEARLMAGATPLSDAAVVGIQGMDDIKDVAKAGFDSNVAIAQSADVSQAMMAWAMVVSNWAWPAFMVALVFVIWAVSNASKKKEGKND